MPRRFALVIMGLLALPAVVPGQLRLPRLYRVDLNIECFIIICQGG